MAVELKASGLGLLCVVLLSLAGLVGCGGSEQGPSEPQLGEEVNLALYEPASLKDYEIVYSVLTNKITETGVRYCNTETVYDYDPALNQDVPIECCVFEQDSDGAGQPAIRYYKAGCYIYGVKVYDSGHWGPLYRFVPRRQVIPEENPRLGETFDSGASCLITRFTMFDTEYRQVQTFRSWTTYVAVEDSVTVPAGTFYDVLKTKVKTRVSTKQTLAADTTHVVFNQLTETIIYDWDARDIGTIKSTEDDNQAHVEKEMIRGKVDGVTYPKKTD
jgi:hypothetical protein